VFRGIQTDKCDVITDNKSDGVILSGNSDVTLSKVCKCDVIPSSNEQIKNIDDGAVTRLASEDIKTMTSHFQDDIKQDAPEEVIVTSQPRGDATRTRDDVITDVAGVTSAEARNREKKANGDVSVLARNIDDVITQAADDVITQAADDVLIEEIDLTAFDFEENFNEQKFWAFKTGDVKLSEQMTSPTARATSRNKTPSKTTATTSLPPIQLTNNRDMTSPAAMGWPTSVADGGGYHEGCHDINIDDVSGRGSQLDTQRSRMSTYEERMRVEWKISEKISSELLMKRVKKMKGRRKKDLGADEKLKKFQLLRNNNCESDVKFVKRNKNDDTKKVDYFKAQQVRREKQEKEENEEKRKFTEKWLHNNPMTTMTSTTRGGSSYGDVTNDSRASTRYTLTPPGAPSSGGNRSFLPPIHPEERMRPNSNDLEMLSINSNRSGLPAPPRDYLLQDIIRRHQHQPRSK